MFDHVFYFELKNLEPAEIEVGVRCVLRVTAARAVCEMRAPVEREGRHGWRVGVRSVMHVLLVALFCPCTRVRLLLRRAK